MKTNIRWGWELGRQEDDGRIDEVTRSGKAYEWGGVGDILVINTWSGKCDETKRRTGIGRKENV